MPRVVNRVTGITKELHLAFRKHIADPTTLYIANKYDQAEACIVDDSGFLRLRLVVMFLDVLDNSLLLGDSARSSSDPHPSPAPLLRSLATSGPPAHTPPNAQHTRGVTSPPAVEAPPALRDGDADADELSYEPPAPTVI